MRLRTFQVYRDSSVSKWVAPFRVIDIDETTISSIYDGKIKTVSIDRRNWYHDPSPRGDDGHGFAESWLDNAITGNPLYAVLSPASIKATGTLIPMKRKIHSSCDS